MATKPAQTADPAELAAELGVHVDPELFRRALTHRSFAYENGDLPHNERLEFLGDSVLGVVVTESLYRAHPDLAEGRLAKLRASVVNMRALADVARRIGPGGIGKYILLGRGEDATGGRDKPSILADTLEAILGAIYLEHGLEVAAQVVHQLFDPVLAAAPGYGAALDWKTSLQELTAVRGAGSPRIRDHLRRPGPRQVLHRRRGGGRHHLRRPARTEQEGSRAGGGRGGLAGAVAGPGAAVTPAEPAPRHSPTAPTCRRPADVPELPEVETVRAGLARWVAGGPSPRSIRCTRAPIRRHLAGPQDLTQRLVGRADRLGAAAGQVLVAAAGRRPGLPDRAPGDERAAADAGARHRTGTASAGPDRFHRRRHRAALPGPADLRWSASGRVGARRSDCGAGRHRPHSPRPAGRPFRRRRLDQLGPPPQHHHQAGAAGPVLDLGSGQHLRRRGAVAGEAARRSAYRRGYPGSR